MINGGGGTLSGSSTIDKRVGKPLGLLHVNKNIHMLKNKQLTSDVCANTYLQRR